MPNPISITPLSNASSTQENNLNNNPAIVKTQSNINPQDSEQYAKESDLRSERQPDSQQSAQNKADSITFSNVFRILGNVEEFQIFSSGVAAYLIHSSGRIISLSAGIDRQHLQFNNGRSHINGVLKNPIGEFLEQKRLEAVEHRADLTTSDTNSEHTIKEQNTNQEEEELVRYTRRGEKEENQDKNPKLVDHYEYDESEDQDETSSQYQANGQITTVSIANKANYSTKEDSDGLKQQSSSIISEQA